MKVHVQREACCAQDDQMGPLETTFEVPDDSSIEALVQAIEHSGFLQYSSSHLSMIGEVRSADLVQVFSRCHCDAKAAEYFVSPQTSIQVLFSGSNEFRFRFVLQP